MVSRKLKEEGQMRVGVEPGSRWRRIRGGNKPRIEYIRRVSGSSKVDFVHFYFLFYFLFFLSFAFILLLFSIFYS